MFIEVLANLPDDDPAQGLVQVQTTRANDFGAGIHYGWFESAEGDTVSLRVCKSSRGDEGAYLLHLNPDHIVAWRYADLLEV